MIHRRHNEHEIRGVRVWELEFRDPADGFDFACGVVNSQNPIGLMIRPIPPSPDDTRWEPARVSYRPHYDMDAGLETGRILVDQNDEPWGVLYHYMGPASFRKVIVDHKGNVVYCEG